MTEINPLIVIPHYNHSTTIREVITKLVVFNLPILIVDDGSAKEQKQVLQTLVGMNNVSLLFRPENGGKGAAVKAGLQWAFERGFTHVIQVDADGQHNLIDIQIMLEKSRQNSTALICGKPIYGKDAPKSRLYGRKITNFWIALNTLSLDIDDGMCGFRLYPLIMVMPILMQERLGDRMDFDIEILVYCRWRKIPMIWVDTQVKYNEKGISHFRSWADNWLISKMHARLFWGMIKRLLTGKF
ncbi:glycosyltransferase family 2 protein [Rodentibacter caecimuris]|uniref:Glycosyl transferase n=1 Tax=Rodentibacter caecimuris TaxID=1796644 RepID=A0ABX3KYJ3_9PAST|nr:glycosyl transferase [Rodentibacter heylii]